MSLGFIKRFFNFAFNLFAHSLIKNEFSDMHNTTVSVGNVSQSEFLPTSPLIRRTLPQQSSSNFFAKCRNNMLGIDVSIEGYIMKAFVDTGAQVTVISAACAKRCNLLDRIDKRFACRAVGVGSANVLGRIHDAYLSIANMHLSCSLMVVDHPGISLLIGLDILRKYQCNISLQHNSLQFLSGGVQHEISFDEYVESK